MPAELTGGSGAGMQDTFLHKTAAFLRWKKSQEERLQELLHNVRALHAGQTREQGERREMGMKAKETRKMPER